MIAHTLFSKEGALTSRGIGDEGFALEQSPRIPFDDTHDISCLCTGDASDRLVGTWFHNRCKNEHYPGIQTGTYIRGNDVPL